jgi:hypothetical protein
MIEAKALFTHQMKFHCIAILNPSEIDKIKISYFFPSLSTNEDFLDYLMIVALPNIVGLFAFQLF